MGRVIIAAPRNHPPVTLEDRAKGGGFHWLDYFAPLVKMPSHLAIAGCGEADSVAAVDPFGYLLAPPPQDQWADYYARLRARLDKRPPESREQTREILKTLAEMVVSGLHSDRVQCLQPPRVRQLKPAIARPSLV